MTDVLQKPPVYSGSCIAEVLLLGKEENGKKKKANMSHLKFFTLAMTKITEKEGL